MTTSPRCWRPFAILSVCGLAWIVILSLALRYFLGAGVSSGWLIIGIMLSAVAAGVVVLIKEFTEAIPLPEHFDLKEGRFYSGYAVGKAAESARPIRSGPREFLDRFHDEHRRKDLGLGPRPVSSNRRRQAARNREESRTGSMVWRGA